MQINFYSIVHPHWDILGSSMHPNHVLFVINRNVEITSIGEAVQRLGLCSNHLVCLPEQPGSIYILVHLQFST